MKPPKYNYRLIKSKNSFTVKEIAEQFGIHARTVQTWIKEGLQVIDKNAKPYLIEGFVLREFLKQKSENRKCKLNEDEFYCTKCKAARKSQPDQIQFNFTHKLIGKNQRQVIIKGKCEICNTQINRFSTESKLIELNQKGVFSTKRDIILIESINAFINTDIGD